MKEEEGDHQLKAQLKYLMSGLKCPSDNPIQRICITATCKQPALHCASIDCQLCFENHHSCVSSLFQAFTREVQRKTAFPLMQFLNGMKKIQSQFLENIQKTRRKISYMFPLEKLVDQIDEQSYRAIESIYKRKKTDAITGQEASQLKLKIEEQRLELGSDESDWLQFFKKVSNRLAEEFISTRNELLDWQLGHSNCKKWIKSTNKQKQDSNVSIDSAVLEANRMSITLQELIDSPNQKIQRYARILNEQIKKIDDQFIFEALEKPSSLQLAFRASNFKFNAYDFHNNCDHLQGSFILARNQHGKVIAGYTPLNWQGEGFKMDFSMKSFLIGVNSKTKMNLLNNSKAIYCSRKMGPTFGGETSLFNFKNSFDFSISDCCHSNNQNSFGQMKSYRSKSKPVEIEQLCGLKGGGNFKITEYEVYKVSYTSQMKIQK